jgi:peroxiredoxin family protein
MREDIDMPTTATFETRLEDLQTEVAALKDQLQAQRVENQLSLICFSGEWDRLFAALTIAAGGLAMGMEVHLFFTFWALGALRNAGKMESNGKSPLQSMFNRILPAGPGNAPLSRLNFGGLGKFMMKRVMKEKGVDDLDTLLNEIIEMGAHFHLCDTTAELFGLQCHELSVGDSVDQCGVATFLSHALKSKVVLFI